MLRFVTSGLALGALTLAGPLDRRALLDDCLSESEVPVSVPGTTDYDFDSAPFNVRTPFTPVAIAVPTTTRHIQDAISCGVKAGVKVTPKGGGHSYGNFGFGGEDGHLVLELDRMSDVVLDVETGLATVQGGSRLGHVASGLYEQGKRGISHGTCPGVGTGGHVAHGGYGVSSHTKGLALDWLVSATVVLANSTVVTASEETNPDLFWAVRGAGSSMGVVSEFVFNTFEVPEKVTRFNVILPWNANNSVARLKALQGWAEEMPAEMNARLFINAQMPNLEGLYYGGKDDLSAILDPLIKEIGGKLQEAKETDWLGQLDHFGHGLDLDQTHPYKKQDNIYSTSLYTDALTDSQLQSLVDYWYTTAKTVRRGWYHHIDFQGGKASAVSAVAANATSYAHRSKLLMHNFYDSTDVTKAYPENGFDLLNGFIEAIVGDADKLDYGVYFNYPDTELDRETAQKRYWGDSLPRLRAIKAAVDPDEVFYMPQSVEPAKADEAELPKEPEETTAPEIVDNGPGSEPEVEPPQETEGTTALEPVAPEPVVPEEPIVEDAE
ncbi:related to reticuline oxidase precursor; berberine bridge enzyme [Cephalotrichum gorgonifer]|uniref:Related to reticuline oxidase berberine bridge enzyme n=1 Tax=Cephalotrichum gorgonifer TaxID=2041049 RepID=A0AAE8MRA8_9PEZI|nr:related to reticuline oxidase precursor; berberine bridge enzyme [Cephalotrichum gorgonifer]